MNNQDYEQKKRECWEEASRRYGISLMNGIIHAAFNYAFDRAYALGKEKETITQEEIEVAAKEYAAEVDKNVRDLYGIENPPTSLTFGECAAESFREGVKFALGKQEKEADAVIQGWVARDDGERWHERELHLFTRNKPERRKLMGDWIGRPSMMLDSSLFPDLTWSDEPEPVEIIIKRKKKNL